jgi:ABC-type nitrate/sulfonate/bicarbonate transport system permease component
VSSVAAVLKRVNVAGWAFVVAVAVLLELAVRQFDLHDSVAAPSDTLEALADGLKSGGLSGDLAATLGHFLQGFAIATVLGVTLGVLLGSSRTLRSGLTVVIEFLRPIPAIALIPIAMLLFGLGAPMIRFVIAYAVVWPILINTLYGVRAVDRTLLDVARTSDVSRIGTVIHVTLPAALPSIATGIRVGASIALVVCITAEYVAGTDGVGAYMRGQEGAFELSAMYAAVVAAGLLGYAIDVALRRAQRRVVFWAGEERVVL